MALNYCLVFHFISKWRTPFSIFCRAIPVVANSPSFVYLGISPPIWMTVLQDNSWLIFFSFSTLIMSSNCLLASKASDKKQLLIILRITCMWWVTYLFLLSRFSYSFWLSTVCLYSVSVYCAYTVTQCVCWSLSCLDLIDLGFVSLCLSSNLFSL